MNSITGFRLRREKVQQTSFFGRRILFNTAILELAFEDQIGIRRLGTDDMNKSVAFRTYLTDFIGSRGDRHYKPESIVILSGFIIGRDHAHIVLTGRNEAGVETPHKLTFILSARDRKRYKVKLSEELINADELGWLFPQYLSDAFGQ